MCHQDCKSKVQIEVIDSTFSNFPLFLRKPLIEVMDKKDDWG